MVSVQSIVRFSCISRCGSKGERPDMRLDIRRQPDPEKLQEKPQNRDPHQEGHQTRKSHTEQQRRFFIDRSFRARSHCQFLSGFFSTSCSQEYTAVCSSCHGSFDPFGVRSGRREKIGEAFSGRSAISRFLSHSTSFWSALVIVVAQIRQPSGASSSGVSSAVQRTSRPLADQPVAAVACSACRHRCARIRQRSEQYSLGRCPRPGTTTTGVPQGQRSVCSFTNG